MKKILLVLFLASLQPSCKKEKEATPTAPFIDFTIDNPKKTNPDTAAFSGTSSKSGTTFQWDFGDGSSIQTGENVTHIFDYGYYFVNLSGTANGQTSTARHGINTSPFTKIFISSVIVTRIPANKSNGEVWDSDGTGPDVFCKLSIPTYSTSTLVMADAGTGSVNLNYSLAPGLVVNSIDQFIKMEVFDSDSPSISDELIESVTLSDGVTSLMTGSTPYAGSATFSGTTTTATIYFQWLN